jgi:hypothetical protein
MQLNQRAAPAERPNATSNAGTLKPLETCSANPYQASREPEPIIQAEVVEDWIVEWLIIWAKTAGYVAGATALACLVSAIIRLTLRN